MKTILLLLDSLNRHMLNAYGNPWVQTPNIDRLAARSVVFDNHWLGSAPCMPARRDILTGRLSFLERNWGPLEPFDVPLPLLLRQNGVFCHMATDHYHYFEVGGEGYCQMFNTWDFIRGQEWDPWVSRTAAPPLPASHYGRLREQYEWNKTAFRDETEYPSPKTLLAACDWLEHNKDAENFFLMLDVFDPHEPFDCPAE
jgi:arylsulfatase A-like enzyme